jgi:hypothetical protein
LIEGARGKRTVTKRRIIAFLIIIFGYSLSYALHTVLGKNSHKGFHEGDFFWVIGMPLICAGVVLFITTLSRQKQINVGIAGKILLLFLIIIWAVGVFALFFW